MRNLYKESIISQFGTPKKEVMTPKGLELNYDCPFCIENRGDPDTKGHLFINAARGIGHCYRCGAAFKVHLEEGDGYSRRELVDNTELLKDLLEVVSDSNDEPLDMIIPLKKALDDQSAREYLNGRGFSDEQIDYYDLRVGSVFSNLLGHVIIPNQVKRKIMTDMYCARSFIGSKPKYRNPPSSKASSSVYNLHKIMDNPDRIIICEGAFNAMAAGKNAVALYGKECSEIKLSKILAKHPNQIVVNLDLDAKDKAYDLARRIKSRDNSIDVRILLIDREGYKDAADFLQSGRIEEYRDLVESSEIYNPLLDGLLGVINND